MLGGENSVACAAKLNRDDHSLDDILFRVAGHGVEARERFKQKVLKRLRLVIAQCGVLQRPDVG
jgi:hypothetical protein